MRKIKKWLLLSAVLIGCMLLSLIYIDVVIIQSLVVASEKSSSQTGESFDGVVSGMPEFINEEMLKAAFDMQNQYGHPVSVCIAQLIAESGYGTYGPGLSGLAYNYKNLFGIKYSTDDTFATGSVNLSTGEETSSGDAYQIVAGFAIYPSYTACINRRSELLTYSRYASKVDAYRNKNIGTYTVEEARKFANGIKEGGWATSTAYVTTLVSIMDQYNLYRYDNMTWALYKKQNVDTIIAGGDAFCNPCPGATYISSTFGYREWDNSFHNGMDYAAPEGTPTYATKDGRVTIAGWSDSAGNWVVIDHGDGFVTKYMHHSFICVYAGQSVKKGQQIGRVGTTGYSSGNHLHFQVELNGTAVDPSLYVK